MNSRIEEKKKRVAELVIVNRKHGEAKMGYDDFWMGWMIANAMRSSSKSYPPPTCPEREKPESNHGLAYVEEWDPGLWGLLVILI